VDPMAIKKCEEETLLISDKLNQAYLLHIIPQANTATTPANLKDSAITKLAIAKKNIVKISNIEFSLKNCIYLSIRLMITPKETPIKILATKFSINSPIIFPT